jgi:hypothetical protein
VVIWRAVGVVAISPLKGRKGRLIPSGKTRGPSRMGIRGDDVYTDGALTFSDRERLFPGDKCQVKILFPKPDLMKKYVTVGTTFDINEGPHKVGEGEILAIPLPTQSFSAL